MVLALYRRYRPDTLLTVIERDLAKLNGLEPLLTHIHITLDSEIN
jgi:hypothetical protein